MDEGIYNRAPGTKTLTSYSTKGVVPSKLIIGSWFTAFILMAPLLAVTHPAPAVDHRLCLQLATYPYTDWTVVSCLLLYLGLH